MQTLNVAEAGITYLFRCIQYYAEGCSYFLLYFLALLWIGFRSEKRMRQMFLPQAVMLLATVLNPVFPVILNRIFDVNKEYYRFLWIVPVGICISAAAVLMVCDHVKGTLRKGIAILALVLIFVSGGTFIYKDGYVRAENLYKMPSELLEVSRIIHEDTDVPFPKAMFEYDYHMLIRQYDASILLPCGRDEYLDVLSNGITEEQLENELYARLLAVAALGMEVGLDDFYEAMEHTNTEYFVLTKGNPAVSYLKKAGLWEAGSTANHVVLRYDMKEPWVFTLEDYSKIWGSD